MLRRAILASGLVLVLASTACERVAAPTTATAPPGEVWLTPQELKDAEVVTEPVEPRPVGGAVRAASRIAFDDMRVAHVYSPVTGKVTRILVQPGQRVKQGQPLTVLESPDLGSAESDVGKARAALIGAEKEWQRQKDLYESHASAQHDVEAAEAAYFNAKSELERARRKAALLGNGPADAVTQDYVLRAPIDGEVIMRAANPGLEVQGQYSGGATVELFTIGELDRVWVIADVFEMDLPRVRVGAPVSVRVLAFPGDGFDGTVEWISGTLDPTSRTARVRCSIANPDGKLRPEMYATATITVSADVRPATRRSALLLLGEQPMVFVEIGATGDGQLKFERRAVAVDEAVVGDYVPVQSGLALHEEVVVSGGVLLLGML